MPRSQPHRKRIKHYDQRGEIHSLTFSCYRRQPLLEDAWAREQFSHAIDRACDSHHWQLAAFVFMPEHVHLLVFPTAAHAKISKLLFAMKRPFSYRMKQRFIASDPELLNRLTIRTRPGATAFRFWQEGPGFDRNIRTEKSLLATLAYFHENPVRRGLVNSAGDYFWSSYRWYQSDGETFDPRLPKLSAVPPSWFVGQSDFTTF